MEGISVSLSKGLRGYWRRKDYERLNGSRRRRSSRVEIATLGSHRRRRFWRIKIAPKLRFFHISSPKKLLVRLRDAYENMMVGMAKRVFFTRFSGGGVGVGAGFERLRLKEYDEKLIAEIYKSLMAKGQLVPRDAWRLASQIVCRP